MWTKSKVDKLLEEQKNKKEKEEKQIQELKKICENACNDVNVKFILKFIKQICLWNDQNNDITPNIAIYNKGRRDVWAILRNIIPKSVLCQIEIYDEG